MREGHFKRKYHSMKYLFTSLLAISALVISPCLAQNVGIGTSSPNAKLDISGDLALRSQAVTVADGITYALDVNTIKSSNYRLTGPTANFVIAGITAGNDGRIITLYNRTGHSLQLYNEDIAANSADRIQTGINTTLDIYPGGNVTLQYDISVNRWTVLSQHNSSLDYTGNAVLPSTAIVLSDQQVNPQLTAAGFTEDGSFSLPVTRFYPELWGWGTAPAALNALSPRGEHTAVWTGSRLLAWGGYDPVTDSYLADGKLYDPATDTWTNMAVSPLEERSLHTAQWTGTSMLIWGGLSTVQTMGNGAIYDPGANTWTTMTTVNAPTSRFDFTSVWTGTDMIVFGGRFVGTIYRSDHKKYNPVTNTWTTIAGLNAPAPRIHHSAVWTGSQMLIYGGRLADGTITNTGYLYDPVADSWTTMTSTGAPPNGNAEHRAVWTGTEMIVSGGRKHPTGTENNIYLYNPATNTWRQGPAVNNPGGTIYHSAVWTGTAMIVLGGIDDIAGVYNPAADTWYSGTITSLYGFSKHAAVWTGARMLITGNAAAQNLQQGIHATQTRQYFLYKKN